MDKVLGTLIAIFVLACFAGLLVRAFQVPKEQLPIPMNREEGKNYVLGYMDRIDFECELGAAAGGNRVFPSPEECKEHKKCCRGGSCGIVEVKVEATRIVEEGDLS